MSAAIPIAALVLEPRGTTVRIRQGPGKRQIGFRAALCLHSREAPNMMARAVRGVRYVKRDLLPLDRGRHEHRRAELALVALDQDAEPAARLRHDRQLLADEIAGLLDITQVAVGPGELHVGLGPGSRAGLEKSGHEAQ